MRIFNEGNDGEVSTAPLSHRLTPLGRTEPSETKKLFWKTWCGRIILLVSGTEQLNYACVERTLASLRFVATFRCVGREEMNCDCRFG